MTITYKYTDGGGTENTIYIAGTSTKTLVKRNSEFGADDPPIRLIGEKTPGRMSDQHRGVVYDPREYGFTLLLKGDDEADLETLKANWSTWHDRELGRGFVTRITGGGNTRCLDCFLQSSDWAEREGYNQDVTATYLARNPFWRDASLTSNVVELTVTNPGFETFTGTEDDGTSDAFTGWTVASDDGNGDKCEASTTKWGGSYAVMLTRGTGTRSQIVSTAAIAVTAGDTLSLSFRTRGDGTYAGTYVILDDTNSETIQNAGTGVTGTSYTAVTYDFTVPAGCSGIKLRFWANATNTAVVYYDSITLTNTAVPNVDSVVYNGTFESGGTGGDFDGGAEADDGTSDDFLNMVEANDDGNGDKCEATATQHGGTYAVMLTRGTGTVASIRTDSIVATAGETMKWSMWTRGDGTYDGRYGVYDVTNSAWITAATATTVTAATYAEVTHSFTVPTGCTAIRLYGLANTTNTAVVYFDDWTLTRTTVVISCANTGDIPSWPYITFTGVVNTPVVTNSDSDAITCSKTTSNADDTLIIDCKTLGTTRRSVKYYENGTGDGAFVQTTSASKFITLPTGTNNLTLSATSGTPTCQVQFYNYYRGLF